MLAEQVSQERPAEEVKPQKKVWYEVVIIITFVHLVSIYALIYHTPKPATIWLTFLTWVFGGLGITMGYHRLWSHNSYKAAFPVRLALALMGTLAFEGSIKWWSLRHRLHHRYLVVNIDTLTQNMILMTLPEGFGTLIWDGCLKRRPILE